MRKHPTSAREIRYKQTEPFSRLIVRSTRLYPSSALTPRTSLRLDTGTAASGTLHSSLDHRLLERAGLVTLTRSQHEYCRVAMALDLQLDFGPEPSSGTAQHLIVLSLLLQPRADAPGRWHRPCSPLRTQHARQHRLPAAPESEAAPTIPVYPTGMKGWLPCHKAHSAA